MKTIEEKLMETNKYESVFCMFMQTCVYCKRMRVKGVLEANGIKFAQLEKEIRFISEEIMYGSYGNTGDIFPNVELYFNSVLNEMKSMFVEATLNNYVEKANEILRTIKTILLIINMINEWNSVSNGVADEWVIPEYCL